MLNRYRRIVQFVLSFFILSSAMLATPALATKSFTYFVMELSHRQKDIDVTDERHKIYGIPLDDTEKYFTGLSAIGNDPDRQSYQDYIKKLEKRWHEWFRPHHQEPMQTEAYPFFKQFMTGRTYSYVLVDDVFLFSEINHCPIYRDCRYFKHGSLSNQAKAVWMAGEFTVYEDVNQTKIYIALDNNSGTYIPDRAKVGQLIKLLQAQLDLSSNVKLIMGFHRAS